MNAYFNAGTFGPLPTPAADAMRAHLEEAYVWGRVGARGYAAWGGLTDRARAAFAAAAGSPAEEIALNHCTTDGCNTVIWALDWSAGDEVITTTHEHPGPDRAAGGAGAPAGRRDPRGRADARGDRGGADVAHAPRRDLARAVDGRRGPAGRRHQRRRPRGRRTRARGRRAGRRRRLLRGRQIWGATTTRTRARSGCAARPGRARCGSRRTRSASWRRRGRGTCRATAMSGPEMQEWTIARRLDAGTVTLSALAGVAAALEWRSELGFDGHLRARRRAGRHVARAARRRSTPSCSRRRPRRRRSSRSGRRAASRPTSSRTARSRACCCGRSPRHGLVRASVGFWNDERDLEKLVDAVR